jgi:flagellar protein FlaG
MEARNRRGDSRPRFGLQRIVRGPGRSRPGLIPAPDAGLEYVMTLDTVLNGVVAGPTGQAGPAVAAHPQPAAPATEPQKDAAASFTQTQALMPPEVSTRQRKELQRGIDGLNSLAQSANRSIRFEVFEGLGHIVAKVVNSETGEVIKTVPPTEMLKTMKSIDEAIGVLLDEKA